MKGKVVFITGSSLGIGRETAFKFAEEGSKIIVTYYKDKKYAFDVAKKCMELGASDVLVLGLNLMDNKNIKDCVENIVKKFGKIDILINNSGVISWKLLKEQTFEEIEEQIRTNLEGLIKVTKECLPYIGEAVINVASGAGKSAYADLSTYCATKFGVRGFTQSLAEELPKIRVFAINPGMTATRMTGFKGTPPEEVAKVIINVAKGKIKPDSERDVDVWEYV